MTKRCDGCNMRLSPDNDGYFCETCQEEFEEAECGAACAPTGLDLPPDTQTWPSDEDRDMASNFAGGCDHCGGLPGNGLSCQDCISDGPDTETWDSDDERGMSEEACPGCGCMPGDGITPGCNDPLGCGYSKKLMGAAISDTQSHIKRESAKFDNDAYMEETIRLEEARKRHNNAPVNAVSVGHVRQLRTQESPNNRIRFGK